MTQVARALTTTSTAFLYRCAVLLGAGYIVTSSRRILARHTLQRSPTSMYATTSSQQFNPTNEGCDDPSTYLQSAGEDELVDEEMTPRYFAEIEEQRRRNRIAAQKSRQRKREYLEHLEKKVKDLNLELARSLCGLDALAWFVAV